MGSVEIGTLSFPLFCFSNYINEIEIKKTESRIYGIKKQFQQKISIMVEI
jgi:hypothetical protein